MSGKDAENMESEDQSQKLDRVQERLKIIKSSIRRDDSAAIGWGRQEEIVGLLSDVTHNFSEDIANRQDKHVEVVQRIATIESELRAVGRDISSQCRLVRDGNGQPSMVHRLSTAENALLHQNTQIHEISSYANSITASRMLTRSQLVLGLSGMLVTALISFAALVATLIKKS